MVTSCDAADGEKTQKLPDIEKEVLTTLRERREEGRGLSGLRCGTAVCEHVSELEARGLVSVERMERDGEAWKLDLELEENN